MIHLIRHAQGENRSSHTNEFFSKNTTIRQHSLSCNPLIRHSHYAGQHNAAVSAKGGDEGACGVCLHPGDTPENTISSATHANAFYPYVLAEEYKNWAWRDSRLTDLGKQQASSARPEIERYAIDVVLVSPLSRTIQTGLLAIPPGPKFIVEDDVRERIGVHPCDLRRSRTELAADFPSVDVTTLSTEEDDKWTPEREPWADLVDRAMRVLAKLKARDETNIAIVTHNDFLQALLLDSELQLASEALRIKFSNAQHLPIVLTWQDSANAKA